ncbi:MAG: hypothetical protein JKX76_01650 [Colwellia sp.]|nr:hypothetical protein [Colwellia sp.]
MNIGDQDLQENTQDSLEHVVTCIYKSDDLPLILEANGYTLSDIYDSYVVPVKPQIKSIKYSRYQPNRTIVPDTQLTIYSSPVTINIKEDGSCEYLYDLLPINHKDFIFEISCFAVYNGCLDILKWCREIDINRCSINLSNIEPTVFTVNLAVKENQWEIVNWAASLTPPVYPPSLTPPALNLIVRSE